MGESKFPLNSALYVDALSSNDTLALLIPRIRAGLNSQRDKRKQKQIEELLLALEDLDRIIAFGDAHVSSAESHGETTFIEGIPRCNFQIESQFEHYVNPTSAWQENWTNQRIAFWEVFEKTIPWAVREILMSWRWRAEREAFRKILESLRQSRLLVANIEEKLMREERRGATHSKYISVFDRVRIILWSRSAKNDESILLSLEQARDALSKKISKTLDDCERLSAVTAVGIRTLFVDCGDLYSRVFEGCCRAIDKEVRIQVENDLKINQRKNSEISGECDDRLRLNQDGMRRVTDHQQKLLQVVEGRFENQLFEAERLLSQEFMCLNSLELEKQDHARSRWQRAITQMRRVLRAAEESFSHGENDIRDVVDDSDGRTSTAQIRG